MYEEFYRFREKPFQLTPNPAYLYKSKKHKNALTCLQYGLSENAGMVVLTGEVGSGKTTLVRHLVRKLGSGFDTAMVANTNISSGQMLRMIQSEFNIPGNGMDKARLIESLNHHFIKQYQNGNRCIIIIDEAQNLSALSLEEVRMLSNLQSDQQALLQVFLIGQPELLQILKRQSMRQFTQRVGIHYHLAALSPKECAAYITHRLKIAGGNPKLFTLEATQQIYKLSMGVPRIINLICDWALVYGFVDGATQITKSIVHQVSEDNLSVGINNDPVKAQTEQATAQKLDDGHNRDSTIEKIESIRMEFISQIEQTKYASVARNKYTLKQILNLLDLERKQNAELRQRVAHLEKNISTLVRRFKQLDSEKL